MSLESVISTLANSSLTEELINRCSREDRLTIKAESLTGKVLISSSLAKKAQSPLLVIVPTIEDGNRWLSILDLLGWKKTFLYPHSEVSPFESTPIASEIVWGQLAVLNELISNAQRDSIAIICTERALHSHLPPPLSLKEKCISIKKGDELDLTELSFNLATCGYAKGSTTDQEGMWSRRGDIIDIYTVNNELPFRLELYGDIVDKLREFDPVTQRSLDEIEQITIVPINFNVQSKELVNDNQDKNDINEELQKIKQILYKYHHNRCSILDYISDSTFVILDERRQCISHTKIWLEHIDLTCTELQNKYKENKEIFNISSSINSIKEDPFIPIENFIGIELFQSEINASDSNNTFHSNSKAITTYPNQFGKISELIKSYQNKNYSIWISSAQPTRASALLEEHECIVKFVQNSHDLVNISKLINQGTPVSLKINSNTDLEGIELAPWKILLLTDREFFGQQIVSSNGYIRKRKIAASKVVNPSKLTSGDYVVHRNHGVGQFMQIEKLIINNESRDYLLVRYLDGTLRVAADQLGSLGRYRGSHDKAPKINKLGGNTWITAKEKARKAINKVAIDLIKLYAERQNTKGYAFPKDGPWQRELEEAFPYEATPDQIKAVAEIKRDMEKSNPMDRLVCGDVGFGKTEVAIRALFKAITSGKQVALLAPTTVLSQQHWRTLSDRFAPYPIKVSLLNRFKSASERKAIITGLKDGKIDAIVGTHLLLSKNVQYKDLGLLVIDEEQRFGVTQKEKIKSLKKHVDVITLSATPIPRTLYMSLSGVREMSLITTPPPLRRAIKTHLVHKEDEIVRSAICQEIGRGGQIFYVVPRISGIGIVAEKIREMVPNIKLIIAHGQMQEGELENAMIAFSSGEADIMLCTTIIESGLDIPTVNTILIEDAHTFGLSQLYQLRGRVGRSGIQAHAWLFYPISSQIQPKAIQRLKAIQQFSELGSGYQLAMRDMEIRGVGNLIGLEQSGQMEAIGFDLYMEILHESIAEIQGQAIPVVEETKVDLPVTAFIPGTWITENEEKLVAYKSASDCETIDKLLELTASWIDRFGALPPPVQSLVLIMKLKIIAKTAGFSRIMQSKPNIVMETLMNESAFNTLRKGIDPHLQSRLIFKRTGNVSTVTFRGLATLDVDSLLEKLIDWLTKMAGQIASIDRSLTNKITQKIKQ